MNRLILHGLHIFAIFFSATATLAMNENLEDNRNLILQKGDQSSKLVDFFGDNDKKVFDRLNIHAKKINKVFKKIDDLFQNVAIKVSNLNKDDEPTDEHITSLGKFCAGTEDQESILEIICRHLPKMRHQIIGEVLKKHEPKNLINALQILQKAQALSSKDAQHIVHKEVPINGYEIDRLFHTGAVKTEKNQLVLLRTGDVYGDILTLEETHRTQSKKKKGEELVDFCNYESEDICSEENVISDKGDDKKSQKNNNASEDYDHLEQVREHFSILNSISRAVSADIDSMSGAASISRNIFMYLSADPRYFSPTILFNYYFYPTAVNLFGFSNVNGFSVDLNGPSYWGSIDMDNSRTRWWLSYTSGYIGGGVSYTHNLDSAFWSNGSTYLTVGAALGGNKNFIRAALSLETVANSVAIAGNVSVSGGRTHEVVPLGTYPIDGPMVKIRGLEGIQIRDVKNIGASGVVAVNLTQVTNGQAPITIAFRAAANFTKDRIFKTHLPKKDVRSVVKEGNKAALWYVLGGKILKSKIPRFDQPEKLIDGDELFEVKIGDLTGAFIVGLEGLIPIQGLRVGASATMRCEFALTLKRLPNNKFEVSIEPRQIYEMSLFGSMLNSFNAGNISTLSIAKKQSFLFDFNNSYGKSAYFKLVEEGILPSFGELEVSKNGLGPSKLIRDFHKQNEDLEYSGVARTFLEEVKISANKIYAGFNAPIIPATLDIVNYIDRKLRKSKQRLNIVFEAPQREFLTAHARSITTDGIIAIKRDTRSNNSIIGNGFSGKKNENIYVSHNRIYTWEAKNEEHEERGTWFFGGLSVQAHYEDSMSLGDEESNLVEKINRLFGAQIGTPSKSNSRYPRKVIVSREFSETELKHVDQIKKKDIEKASHASGINKFIISQLVDRLREQDADRQGIILKHFIKTADGSKGFAAVHHLFGGDPLHLKISSEGPYAKAVQDARMFIAKHTICDEDGSNCSNDLLTNKDLCNIITVKNFYRKARFHLGNIDRALRYLGDDQFMIDPDGKFIKIYGEEVFQELIKKGFRQNRADVKKPLIAMRQELINFIDLDKQNLSKEEQEKILKIAKKKRVLIRDLVSRLTDFYGEEKVNARHSQKEIRSRFKETWTLLDKINTRLDLAEKDEEMTRLDPDYIEETKKSLNRMKEDLIGIINVEHLKTDEVTYFHEIFKLSCKPKLHKLFPQMDCRIKEFFELELGWRNEHDYAIK